MPSRALLLPGIAIMVAAGAGLTSLQARDLSLADRVRAQEEIERVYHAHQIGATTPFESAVPRPVLEAKVRLYLRKSVALERIWKVPITAPMLRAEMERMIRRSRTPDRLRELFAALRNDPVVIQECLARPALVDRLARSFFASDHPGEQWDTWWSRIEADLDASSVRVAAADGQPVPVVAGPADPLPADGVPDDVWDNDGLGEVPDPRALPSSVWTGTEMLVWGGYVNDITLDTGSRYDPVTDTWTPIATFHAPTGRYMHTAVWIGTRMIVWGGYTIPGGAVTNSGGIYDPLLNAWSPVSVNGAPSGRRGHTAIWSGTEMLIWGGYPNGGDGARYDPEGDSWKPIAMNDAPSSRSDHTAIWTGSRMIVWGGDSGALPLQFLDTGGLYDPVSDTWTTTSTVAVPQARESHKAVWTGSRMIVWGGQAREADSFPTLNTGGVYDPAANSWQPTSTVNAPSPRTGHTAVWTGEAMIVWGDSDGSGSTGPGTGGSYDPVDNTWGPTSMMGAPPGRFGHTAVWTGSLMIVWGGTVYSGYSNTGGRYDPLADSWTPTSPGKGPPACQDPAVVWTGTEMIVWGGSDYLRGVNTGGRYDPALDTWSPTSMIDAPSARSALTAVWTGSVMVVWGGDGISTYGENTGGRYDPVADTWTPTSIVDAPSPRNNHSAIWTGSAMVVWGGQIYDPATFSHTYLATGGRYDPVGDTWLATSMTNAPGGRSLHTAVWAADRMLVWGGFGGSVFLATGGAYDPIANHWTPTSMAGTPAARYEHEAVWTGSRMLIWGGSGGGGLLGSGARYNPGNDTWSPIATAGAPTPGRYPTAVWTGDRMVIWGGWIALGGGVNLMLDTGGRYDPVNNVWSPTTTVGAPTARRRHVAVWTGFQMIVWGGSNGALAVLASGGRYGLCAGITFYRDTDGDGLGDPGVPLRACEPPPGYVAVGGDCNDADSAAWAPPGEATTLGFTSATTLAWTAPAASGATTLSYDLIRSDDPADSVSGSVCAASDLAVTTADDPDLPSLAQAFYYLVRAQNGCPAGEGPLGSGSDGVARTARSCP